MQLFRNTAREFQIHTQQQTHCLTHTHTHTHTHTESDFVNLLLKSHRRGENEKPFILVTMYFQNSLHTGFVDIFRIKRTSFLKKHHPEKA